MLNLYKISPKKGTANRTDMWDTIQQLDFQILDWIRANLHSSVLDPVMVFFTHLGSSVTWVALCIVLLLLPKTRKDAFVAGCGLLTGVLVANVILKNVVRRARPCWLRPDIPLLISSPTDYSFPSGHTMAATIFTVIMVKKHPKLAFLLIPAALLIMFSRLYLYVHFPSDVLFSLVCGTVIGVLTCAVETKVKKRQI